MSSSLRVLIVEDERILAETISGMVEDLGHKVVAQAHNLKDAHRRIEAGGFDMAILDINLKTGYEGIELGKLLSSTQVPFFYLTSYSDAETLKQAKENRPGAFVVKPFTEVDLYVAIEMSTINLGSDQQPSIVVRKGNAYTRVNVSDILFLKAENIYTELHTKDKVWLKRSSLKDLLEEIGDEPFIQTHRSFAVNTQYVTGWSNHIIFVGENEIPVSRRNWDEIKERLEANLS